jgi:hypothetical protein
LPNAIRSERRAEIDSDLAEHHAARRSDGWRAHKVGRESLWRAARGAPQDLAWRHEILASGYRSTSIVRVVVLAVASTGSLAVAVFYSLFGVYLLGRVTLSEHTGLAGLDSYAQEVGTTSGDIGGVAMIVLAGVVVTSCVIRPVAPLVANVATTPIAILLVGWFWLGAAPIGAITVIAALVDMVLRAPALRSSG